MSQHLNNIQATSTIEQQTSYLRVPADKVTRLMDMVGELGLSVSETVNSNDLHGLELEEFEKSAHRLKMIVR